MPGTLTDNPLTNVATTMNSAGLANLAAIASQHAVITLDPLRAAGAPEIIVVTAHTGAATSATVARGAYGTSARQHAQGTLWVHAPITEDFLAIVTAGTRPSDPYRGQLIFETDTDKLVARSIADAWQEVVDLGAWDTWTPTLANLTLGSGTVTAKFTRVGRTIFYRFRFLLGAGSAVGTAPTFTLPVAASSEYATGTQGDVVGVARFRDTGTSDFNGSVVLNSTTTGRPVVHTAGGTYVAGADLSSSVPMTWVSTDALFASGHYEAAA